MSYRDEDHALLERIRAEKAEAEALLEELAEDNPKEPSANEDASLQTLIDFLDGSEPNAERAKTLEEKRAELDRLLGDQDLRQRLDGLDNFLRELKGATKARSGSRENDVAARLKQNLLPALKKLEPRPWKDSDLLNWRHRDALYAEYFEAHERLTLTLSVLRKASTSARIRDLCKSLLSKMNTIRKRVAERRHLEGLRVAGNRPDERSVDAEKARSMSKAREVFRSMYVALAIFALARGLILDAGYENPWTLGLAGLVAMACGLRLFRWFHGSNLR